MDEEAIGDVLGAACFSAFVTPRRVNDITKSKRVQSHGNRICFYDLASQ